MLTLTRIPDASIDMVFGDPDYNAGIDGTLKCTNPAMRKPDSMLLADGDSACFDAPKIGGGELEAIVDDYMRLPAKKSLQQRKEKTAAELAGLVRLTAGKPVAPNTVLLPRAIRSKGRVYLTEAGAVVSTNFICITAKDRSDAAVLATWFCTVFYQLVCEINAKPQEGMRKMEVGDIEETYIPVFAGLTAAERESLAAEAAGVEFLALCSPKARRVDELWAGILYGAEAGARLAEAARLLEFLANARNPGAAGATMLEAAWPART